MDFTYFIILSWIPLAAGLFAVTKPVRATTLAYLGGWLLLPVAQIPIAGFWDVDKILATNTGVMLGLLLFAPGQFRRYRITLADLAIVLFAAGTFVTSIANGLGAYDGVSTATHKLLYYAVPFVIGRAVLKTREDLIEAGRLITFGAVLYAIPAVWEWRMSPQIHNTIYGFFQHGFDQHRRWGFFRPIVCFPHALALGMFLAWTSLLGVCLVRARQLRPVWGIPPTLLMLLPIIALLCSMSVGPWLLFATGLGAIVLWNHPKRRYLVWFPVVFAVGWMAARYSGVSDGEWIVSAVKEVSNDRAHSLQYRIDAESMALDRARERPVFGWGGWGRYNITDEGGRDVVAYDGLWIIFAAAYGLVGLASFYLWWCAPLFMSRGATGELERNPVLPAVLIAVALQAVNLLFNGFLSPVLTLLNGGAVTALVGLKREAVAGRQQRDRARQGHGANASGRAPQRPHAVRAGTRLLSS